MLAVVHSLLLAQILQCVGLTLYREYRDLVQAKKTASDYDAGTEHKLHRGGWDWHSYILRVCDIRQIKVAKCRANLSTL
jgi:hypothetical protein